MKSYLPSLSINTMILFTEEEIKKLPYKSGLRNIKSQCDSCQSIYYATKMTYWSQKHGLTKGKKTYCSTKCRGQAMKTGKESTCDCCGVPIYINTEGLKLYKNHFCGHSCGTRYKNRHFPVENGKKRSKLEQWIESELKLRYPHLEMVYNNRTTIKAELDIYIPSLNLAFELNGIFHYEPIFGQLQLERTQNNDSRKFQACLERQIELCIIDVNKQKYYKQNKQLYLDIITKIIDEKATRNRIENMS